MNSHADRGSRNPGPFAYLGCDGTLFRAGYYQEGQGRVYRAEYGLAPILMQTGEVFE